MLKYLCILFLLVSNIYSQDTSHSVRKDTLAIPFYPLSQLKYKFLSSIPDTISRQRILWLPLKQLEDVFNYLPAYYYKYMDVGQYSNISHNQLDYLNTLVMRNEKPLNDLIDGSIDLNLLSRNEISYIEQSSGNTQYNFANTVNIISRQIFQFRPYSEISFWQDRFENLYFDGNYHQNIFKIWNFNFGITKHSYDGHYTNAKFDKWLGRFNLNYIGSKKFNMFLNVNYASIYRGMNEGIDPTKTILDKDNLFNVSTAIVRNSDAYEGKKRFDINTGFILLAGKNNLSVTKLNAYVDNSLRQYRDEENTPTPNGIYLKENTRWITYGLRAEQRFDFKLGKNSNLTSRSVFEYNWDLFDTPFSTLRKGNRTQLLQQLNLNAGIFFIEAYGKGINKSAYEEKFFPEGGFTGSFFFNMKKINLNLYCGYQSLSRLPTYQEIFFTRRSGISETFQILNAGFKSEFPFGKISFEYFKATFGYRNILNPYLNVSFSYNPLNKYTYYGFNGNLGFKLGPLEFEGVAQFNSDITYSSVPKKAASGTLSYHNLFFNNKLEIKIGFNSKYWDENYSEFYNGRYSGFTDRVVDTSASNYNITIPQGFTLDFFIIAKIDKAIAGFTLENILNRLNYNLGIYPFQNRGGFGNVVSRFNITWYFLN